MDRYALECRELCKAWPGFAMDHVSFTLPKGCIMGYIGENGAGKSTTIRMIMDMIRPDSGEIRILGEESTQLSRETKEKIGVVLDTCNLPEELNIKQINKIFRSIYRSWEEDTFYRYVQTFGLPDNKIIKDFSKGMKMKLAIGTALSHRPQLLILDEATSGLDPIVRDEILDVFYDFIQNEENSILLSSHIISDLEKICDYITFIHKGKLIMSEEKDRILEKHGLLRCSEQELEQLPENAVIRAKCGVGGAEALVLRDKVPAGMELQEAGLEEIMLHYIKRQ